MCIPHYFVFISEYVIIDYLFGLFMSLIGCSEIWRTKPRHIDIFTGHALIYTC